MKASLAGDAFTQTRLMPAIRVQQAFIPSAGPPKISRFFFPSPAAKCVLFFPLCVSSRGILVVFLKAGALKCARLEFSG